MKNLKIFFIMLFCLFVSYPLLAHTPEEVLSQPPLISDEDKKLNQLLEIDIYKDIFNSNRDFYSFDNFFFNETVDLSKQAEAKKQKVKETVLDRYVLPYPEEELALENKILEANYISLYNILNKAMSENPVFQHYAIMGHNIDFLTAKEFDQVTNFLKGKGEDYYYKQYKETFIVTINEFVKIFINTEQYEIRIICKYTGKLVMRAK